MRWYSYTNTIMIPFLFKDVLFAFFLLNLRSLHQYGTLQSRFEDLPLSLMITFLGLTLIPLFCWGHEYHDSAAQTDFYIAIIRTY